MTKRIFKNTMLIVFTVVILCSVCIMAEVYGYYNKELSEKMTEEAEYLCAGVELNGIEYLETMGETKIRITWVDADGSVLYDNRADVNNMDNHGDREEIKKAITSSVGNSIRYSNTISEKTIYHAVRLEDGTVLRVAHTQKSVFVIILNMIIPVMIIVVLALILTGFLAYRLSKQIIEPLERIDLDNPREEEVYDEMSPFIRKIKHQSNEIKDTMDALSAQKREFELITKNMQEGFIVIDKEGKILSHNKSALILFGVKHPVENKHVMILDRDSEFNEAVDLGLSGIHNERVISVGEKYYNIYVNPVFEKDMVAGAVIIATDVTEKEERENLRREFSANVSHELKTPLTAISGTAEIIKNGIVEPKDIPQFAGNIYEEAKRLINLVEDIIKVSKLDEGNVGPEKEKFDLYQLAGEVMKRLEPAAEKNGISIDLKGRTVNISGIKSVVDEMVYNLCDNAVKYNKKDGMITIHVGERDNGRGFITISDTGIGIEKEQQERIFERFYRVDKSHSKSIGGTGLGLSIVKHGAKLHDAVIKIDSEINRGTSISIEF